MAGEQEVSIKLVLNSDAEKEAKDIVEKLKAAQNEVEENAKKKKFFGEDFGKKVGGGASKVIMGMAGAYVAAAGAAALYAKEAMGAYASDQEQLRGLQGTLTLIDDGAHTMSQLKGAAMDVSDGMSTLTAQTGLSKDALVEAWTDITNRGYMAADAAVEFTGNMAYAGKAIPGGMAAISGGLEAIQGGMVRAKNPIVAMIATTGLLKGTAKDVAKEMQKMSLDKQVELAQKAVGKMADRMRELPLTLGESLEVVDEAKSQFFEAMGQPIMDAATEALADLRGMLFDSEGNNSPLLDSLLETGKEFGEMVGTALDLTVETGKGFIEGWRAASDDIRLIAKEFFGDEKLAGMKETGKTMGETIGKATAEFVAAMVMAAGIMSKAAAAVAELLAATADVGALFGDEDAKVASKELHGVASAARNAEIVEKLKNDSFNTSGEEDAARVELIYNMLRSGEDADEKFNEVKEFKHNTFNTKYDADAAVRSGNAESYLAAYNEAMAANNDGAAKYIAGLIESNSDIAYAMEFTGPELLKGGRDGFIDKLKSLHTPEGDAAAGRFEASWKTSVGGAKADKPINFNNATFKINQDFKDQDPDRIVAIFRRDVAKEAGAAVRSKISPTMGF